MPERKQLPVSFLWSRLPGNIIGYKCDWHKQAHLSKKQTTQEDGRVSVKAVLRCTAAESDVTIDNDKCTTAG